MNETNLREVLAQASEREYKRAGSVHGSCLPVVFTSSVYLDGENEQVNWPRVRTPRGELPLEVYKATSTQQSYFKEVVSYMEQGLSQRGAARVNSKPLSKSAASRMWHEKSVEQLELDYLRSERHFFKHKLHRKFF